MKILIAEDDFLVSTVYVRVLKRNGHEVKSFSRGEDLLLELSNFTPELVFLDVNLSGSLNGFETAKQIREKLGPQIPLIFTSGNSIREIMEETSSIANSFVLSKPVSTTDLLSFINNQK